MKYLISNEQDVQDLVVEVLDTLRELRGSTSKSATVLALSGDLGSGKTTFTKALAKELGITEHVTSPTFVIQKSYAISQNKDNKMQGVLQFKKLVHIDAYRLESGADAEALDLYITLQEENNLVVIEWAKNIESALPKNALQIHFEYKNETTREVILG